MTDDEPKKPLFDQWGQLKETSPDNKTVNDSPPEVYQTKDWDKDYQLKPRRFVSDIEEESDGWDGTPQKHTKFQKLRMTTEWAILYYVLHPMLTIYWMILIRLFFYKMNRNNPNTATAVSMIVLLHLCVFVRLIETNYSNLRFYAFYYVVIMSIALFLL